LHPTTQIGASVPHNETNKPTATDNQPARLGFNSSEPSSGGKDSVFSGIVSNQEKRRDVPKNLLLKGKLIWKHADDVSDASDVAQGLYSSQGKMSDLATEGTDAPQINDAAEVFTVPALGEDTNTDTSEVNSGQSKGVTAPAGNSSLTSEGKDYTSLPKEQIPDEFRGC